MILNQRTAQSGLMMNNMEKVVKPMLHLDAGHILETQLARSLGLDKYAYIIQTVQQKDISSYAGFQRIFNSFYTVRRNTEWRECYYKLFERAKKEHYTFADVIGCLYVETGNVEASFTSKMISAINPDKPIWDQYVLENLGLELTGKTPRERISNAIAIYDSIEKWYKDYLLTREAQENVQEFDRRLPSYKWITAIKKIDYLLWGNRDHEKEY